MKSGPLCVCRQIDCLHLERGEWKVFIRMPKSPIVRPFDAMDGESSLIRLCSHVIERRTLAS